MADALLGGIVINEVLVDPNGSSPSFDTDGNGTSASTDEYVEFYNTSTSAIDISGLELWDAGAGNWFTFPAGSILQPGTHALVLTGVQSGGALPKGGPDDLFFDAGRGSAVINNGGDNLTLYDPANDEYIQATFNGDAPTIRRRARAAIRGFQPRQPRSAAARISAATRTANRYSEAATVRIRSPVTHRPRASPMSVSPAAQSSKRQTAP